MAHGTFAVLMAATIGLAGCSESPLVCTDEAVPGLQVHVRDATTDAELGTSAAGVARDGDYEEVLHSSGSTAADLLVGAHERPGTYTVTVSHPGYVAWSQSNVRVTENDCHVNTVELDARLTAEP